MFRPEQAADGCYPHSASVGQRLIRNPGILDVIPEICQGHLGGGTQNIVFKGIFLLSPGQHPQSNVSGVRFIVSGLNGVQKDKSLARIVGELALLIVERHIILSRSVQESLNPSKKGLYSLSSPQLGRHPHGIAQGHPVKGSGNFVSHTVTSWQFIITYCYYNLYCYLHYNII